MEEFCRQLCVIKDISKEKAENIIGIVHIINIIVKALIEIIFTAIIIKTFWNSEDKLLRVIKRADFLEVVDTNEVSSMYYLTIVIIFVFIGIIVIDIIDLVINRERSFGQLIFIAALDYSLFVLILSKFTQYKFLEILGISLLEPIIYLCTVCVVYVRIQYKKKIYHQKIMEEQQQYRKKHEQDKIK